MLSKFTFYKLRDHPILMWVSVIFLFAILAIWTLGDYLNFQVPKIFALGGDNYDLTYTLYKYFFTRLEEGDIAFFNPYLWAGTRLIGDPNFQLNIFQIIIGMVTGIKGVLYFTSFSVVLEKVIAGVGFFALLRRLCGNLPIHIIFLLSIAYIFSTGYHAVAAFPSTSVSLAILPWALLILIDFPNKIFSIKTLFLSLLLTHLFSYGQLQYSIYAGWIILFFSIFFNIKGQRSKCILVLSAAGLMAVLMSSYYLIPLIDNVYISGEDARALSKLNKNAELVPFFYLIQLFIPGIFTTGNWWPIWVDGWTSWEAFSAFQGIAISVIAFFGLFIKSVPVFFRISYIFIMLTAITKPGVYISYLLNLGSSVPYGRETVLLSFFAPIISAYTINELINNKKLPLYFAGWAMLVFFGISILSLPIFFNNFVEFVFSSAVKTHPYSPLLHNPDTFLASYKNEFDHVFLSAKMISISISLLAIFLVIISKKVKKYEFKIYAIYVFTFMLLINSVSLLSNYISSESKLPKGIVRDIVTTDYEHPAERKLKDLMGGEESALISYRVHTDIYFGEHRQGTESVNGKQIRHLINASPIENRFRTLPNLLASEKVALTTGYSSIIPQAKPYSKIMAWANNFPGYERAVGERGHLHPGFMDIFSIKWVLRHKSNITESLGGRKNWEDQIEKNFIENSTLIYEDDAYQIFEYKKAQPLINFPKRIIFGSDAVTTMSDAESLGKWIPTAVLRPNEIKKFPEEIQRRILYYKDLPILKQVGTVLSSNGNPENSFSISVSTKESSILMTGVKYDTWWQVHVNGKSAELIRVNDIFSAVLVPKGESRIEMSLMPKSALIGFSISIITALFTFLIFTFLYLRRLLNLKK
jgi:hypothetical protein